MRFLELPISRLLPAPTKRLNTMRYLAAVLVCVATAGLARWLTPWLAPTNMAMLLLLSVFLVAWRLGRGPAMLAAFLSVAVFDFLFVPPHFSFAIADSQYLITFAVMLAVALVTGQLAAVAKERLRYAELAEAARDQAEMARLRHSILASLSHDLRTPLTGLVGLAETLARGNLPPPHDETARALHAQAKDLAAMVNNLLDLARLTSGSRPLRKEWQPLEEVVGATLRLLEPALGSRPVEVDLAENMPLAEIDAVLFERALGNLIDNAIRHTPPGTPIAISAWRSDGDIALRVRDRGPGFPAALAPGLGLTICRAIVEAHGGRMMLDNIPGGGASATLFLPGGTPPEIDGEIT